MIKIAVIIVHNKTDLENETQILDLLPLIKKQTEGTGENEKYWYVLDGLKIEHEALFYQTIPFGVTPPFSLNQIDSWKIFFGEGDEDKIGDHSRFFNWGVKTATNHGAQKIIYLEDLKSFDVQSLEIDLSKEGLYAENTYGKIVDKQLLEDKGQLSEETPFSESIEELKEKL